MNHVGRPSNEELKLRKRKQTMKIVIPLIVVVLVVGVVLALTGSLNNLMGNSVTETYYFCDEGYTLNGSKCYKEIKSNAYLLGDVDNDGKITVADTVKMQKYIGKVVKLNEFEISAADINKNEKVDNEDIIVIRKYIVGIENPSTVGGESSLNNKIGKEYICPSSYKLSNKECIKTEVKEAKKSSFTCPSKDYYIEGNKCVKTNEINQVLLGDVDNNGKVDAKDYTKLSKYVSTRLTSYDDYAKETLDMSRLSITSKISADINKDGIVDSEDEKALSSYLNDKSNSQIGIEKLCPYGYEAKGLKCIKKETTGLVKNGYYCEDASYVLTGNQCHKTVNEKKILLGDANKDGRIDKEDSMVILRYSTGSELGYDDFSQEASDVNEDGQIDAIDARCILRYVSNLKISYDIGHKSLCPKGYQENGDYCKKTFNTPAKKV